MTRRYTAAELQQAARMPTRHAALIQKTLSEPHVVSSPLPFNTLDLDPQGRWLVVDVDDIEDREQAMRGPVVSRHSTLWGAVAGLAGKHRLKRAVVDVRDRARVHVVVGASGLRVWGFGFTREDAILSAQLSDADVNLCVVTTTGIDDVEFNVLQPPARVPTDLASYGLTPDLSEP
jgi:hypothetical protein